MNDDDFMTAMRDRFAAVRMGTPATAIMARGASLRRRRSGGRLAASALAISLGAGLSVPALTAGTTGTGIGTGITGTSGTTTGAAHQASLAAWTVQIHPDGSIGVTIRRPQDLAALQLRLARLGVPVIIVDGLAKPASGCGPLTVRQLLASQKVTTRFMPLTHTVFFKVRPGRLPLHVVLWIGLPVHALKAEHGHLPPLGLIRAPLLFAFVCGRPLLHPLKAVPEPSA